MGGVSWRGGSQGVVKPMAIAWFKMENAYIFYNVIETFWWRKLTKVERWMFFIPFKLQMILA
jgi:hypothetical protein